MSTRPGRFTGYGWPVLTPVTTGPLPRLRLWVIPGANRKILLRDGSVGFLLVLFALWWHERINPLDGGIFDEWGFADRPVRGTTTVTSEHAGGCAEDLDATEHPRGVPLLRTFKPWQILKIRRHLNRFRTSSGRRVVGWGGDFRTTVDGMHVEMANGATLSDVEQVARRLLDTPRGRRILEANPGAREVIRQ